MNDTGEPHPALAAPADGADGADDLPVACAALRRLLDEQGVRDACMRYLAGVDLKDVELFRSAFADGALLSLFGGERVVRVADIVDPNDFGGSHPSTAHAVASQHVVVDGDTAVVENVVVAHLGSDTGPILVRGLRYSDRLVRTRDGWRIIRRDHAVLWQYDAERVDPHL